MIFHTGSHKGAGFDVRLPTITEHIKHVLERADPKRAKLLIENNAGLGGCVGARFEEIATMLSALNDKRVAVCFDTCHAFASGYDERTADTVSATIDELDRVVGLSRVEVVHCNDSVTGLGSNRDRHANILEGELGEKLGVFLSNARLQELPAVLETAGPDNHGPDANEVQKTKDLRARWLK